MGMLKLNYIHPKYCTNKLVTFLFCCVIRNADVAVMDAGDIYTAGLHYDEIPFITEMYDLPEPEYYVVAVAKEEDPDTEISFLKGLF